mmetsp:Transcript_10297/g.30528  ORF Transcript_10297/g.30528 Transcript_10297/m.30528 type:complete len:220 (+) Transcript_10297:392-1051(+)
MPVRPRLPSTPQSLPGPCSRQVKYRKVRAGTLVTRPCPVVHVMVAGTALGVDLSKEPEMSFLVEFLLSSTRQLPAGWEQTPPTSDVITGEKGELVRFFNEISGEGGAVHPFRAEVETLRAQVFARTSALVTEALDGMDETTKRAHGFDDDDIDKAERAGESAASAGVAAWVHNAKMRVQELGTSGSGQSSGVHPADEAVEGSVPADPGASGAGPGGNRG